MEEENLKRIADALDELVKLKRQELKVEKLEEVDEVFN